MDKEGHVPAFPFGFGLSYTAFEYGNLRLNQDTIGVDDTVQASVDITNTGSVAGAETAQLYVGYGGSQVERPILELKGFQKVELKASETKEVVFKLSPRQLTYYDRDRPCWIIEPIAYNIYVGPSS